MKSESRMSGEARGPKLNPNGIQEPRLSRSRSVLDCGSPLPLLPHARPTRRRNYAPGFSYVFGQSARGLAHSKHESE